MRTRLHLAPEPSQEGASWSLGRPIRVVLADDHTLMLRALRALLDGEDGVEVVAEAHDLAGVVRHVRGHQPEVVVLDLGMSAGSSVEVIHQVRRETSHTEIVVLTMEDSPAFARQTLDAGAIGFVLKDCADIELSLAIHSAARGEEYLSPRIAAQCGLRPARSSSAAWGRSR